MYPTISKISIFLGAYRGSVIGEKTIFRRYFILCFVSSDILFCILVRYLVYIMLYVSFFSENEVIHDLTTCSRLIFFYYSNMCLYCGYKLRPHAHCLDFVH